MNFLRYVSAVGLLTLCATANAQQWNVDAPVPSVLSKRTFADPTSVAIYKDKAEELVGRWGILRPDGVVEIMADRPASFGSTNVPVVKVTLESTKPVYRSVISKTSGLKAVIPIIDLNLSNDEKASIQVSDVAQFIVSTMPQSSDWGKNSEDPGVGKPRLVYIGAALLSVAEVSILKKKSGGITAFFSGINLGAAGSFDQDTSSITNVLSIAIYEPTCRKLANCNVPSVGNANLAPLAGAVKGFLSSTKTASEGLK
ncbi:hypothetical protein [Novosphingobium resinovorum]|uniref:hypothetical protein n=1 Tax=Novosphingobium resinovorum TaxID=158500 RepID=UPI0012EA19B7|nr:hypothetical protein [Novosphingobium resinovorum]